MVITNAKKYMNTNDDGQHSPSILATIDGTEVAGPLTIADAD